MTPWVILGVVVLLLTLVAINTARLRADRELAARDTGTSLLTQAAEISESIRIWVTHPDSATAGIWADLVMHCEQAVGAAQQLAAGSSNHARRARVSALADALSDVAEQLRRRDVPPYDTGSPAALLGAVERLDAAVEVLQADF